MSTNKNMTEREICELRTRVKAMSPEELAVVAEAMPVEFCMARVRSEIDRLKEIESRLGQMISMMEK